MICLSIALIACLCVHGQRVYFDKSGKATDESGAYYFRELTDGMDSYRSYYMSSQSLYFEGRITSASNTNEAQNRYAGRCVWYYKNGRQKLVQPYNEEGQLDGLVSHYYESGSVWKEFPFSKGILEGNYYSEYDEDGYRTRVFHETFESNVNDWDLYTSDQSEAKLENGKLILISNEAKGTSRFINLQSESSEFSVECQVNIRSVRSGQKAGLILGFRDWDNYWYFTISKDSFFIGYMYEGILTEKAQGRYSSEISFSEDNILKVITQENKFLFSINGSVQFSCARTKLSGRNYGFIVTGAKGSKAIFDELIFKEFDFGFSDNSPSDAAIQSSGSGLIISTDGYFVTNYHVIEDSKEIFVEFANEGKTETFKTRIVQQDRANDLAILKIEDDRFKPLESLHYSVRQSGGIDVGADVFTIGFPLALSGLGKEPKFSDGKISAKTGYNNAVNSFQTTIAVQPGNSGGPLFNHHGELIGIINASVSDTDNISYAIKIPNLINLADLIVEIPKLPDSRQLENSNLEDQIKELTKYVVLVKSK